jgi:hypothetical protein
MAEVTSTHAKVSAKADTADATLVQPSDWNEDHVFGAGTKGDLLYRDTGATNGASWLTSVAAGQVLRSGGAGSAPVWGDVDLTAEVSGVLPCANGGTGLSSYAVGDLLYASGATTLAKLAGVATGNVLLSGGVTTAPAWGKVAQAHLATPSSGAYGYWTRTGTVLSCATAGDTLAIAAVGPHAIGAAAGSIAAAVYVAGAWSASGASSLSTGLRGGHAITGVSGNTSELSGQHWESTITTQAGETVAVVAQARFYEPNITVGSGGSVSTAAAVYINGAPTEGSANYALYVAAGANRFGGTVQVDGAATLASTLAVTSTVAVTAAGSHVVGSATPSTTAAWFQTGTFTGGAASFATGHRFGVTLQGASTNTSELSGQHWEGSINVAASTAVTTVAQARFYEPNITLGAGASVATASTVLINGAPTEGAQNYALYVAAGTNRFTGQILTETGIAPVTGDGAYLGTSSQSFSDLFLASGAVINFNAGNFTLTHSAGTLTASGVVVFGGIPRFNGSTQTTVGGTGVASTLPAAPAGYLEVNVAGTAHVMPYFAKS